jgi:hypothetical protein
MVVLFIFLILHFGGVLAFFTIGGMESDLDQQSMQFDSPGKYLMAPEVLAHKAGFWLFKKREKKSVTQISVYTSEAGGGGKGTVTFTIVAGGGGGRE